VSADHIAVGKEASGGGPGLVRRIAVQNQPPPCDEKFAEVIAHYVLHVCISPMEHILLGRWIWWRH
jgi:hypothetical protein